MKLKRKYGKSYSESMILVGKGFDLFSKMIFFHSMFRDGQINKKEMKKMMNDMSTLGKFGFEAKYGEGDAKEMIANFDENDDGKISLEEFLKMFDY